MKKILLILLVVIGVALTGCSFEPQPQNSSYKNDAAKVEQTQSKVQKSVPIPTITTSAERKNISGRATLFDNENLTTYIYLLSKQGAVVAFYPVRGKVSSLNSYLTPLDKLVKWDGSACDWSFSGQCYVVSAPDIDGAYGENAAGIFFFTADTGAYIEWNGEYMVSSQPLKLSTQPLLVREVK